MEIKNHIPNALTLGNLLCGCIALLNIFQGNLIEGAYFVGGSLLFDFFDGFAARALKAHSLIGKDLDSLADMVSFGVVPGMMMFKIIASLTGAYYGDGFFEAFKQGSNAWLPCSGFVIILFSALRLAKFNNDPRQSEGFIGLPTPANGMLICSLPLIFNFGQPYQRIEQLDMVFIMDGSNLAIMACILSLLLVTELPLMSFKFKSWGWKGNESRYLFLSFALLLIFTLKLAAIPLLIIAYVLQGLVQNIFSRKET